MTTTGTEGGTMWRGPLYLLAILGTAVMASGYVIGGLLAGATGFTSLLLAASVPMAAIAWAITVSSLQQDRDAMDRWERRADDTPPDRGPRSR